MITITHALAFAGISFRVSENESNDDGQDTTAHLHQYVVYFGVTVSAVVFCFLLVMVGMGDLRAWLYEQSAQLHHHERLLERLKKEMPQTAGLIANFGKKHSLSRVSQKSDGSLTAPASISSLLWQGVVSLATCACFFNRVSPNARDDPVDEESGLFGSPSDRGPSGKEKEGATARMSDAQRPGDAVPASSVDRSITAVSAAVSSPLLGSEARDGAWGETEGEAGSSLEARAAAVVLHAV